jgi:23S rRNA (uracil1939-C5)-methyltransferase
VGRFQGQVVFVPGALPGEVVSARVTGLKRSFARGQLVGVVQPSPHRITPHCPYLNQCGGCALQHVAYPEQLRLKQKIVQEALQRIGRLPEVTVRPTLGMADPWRYRNKIEVHVGVGKSGAEPNFLLENVDNGASISEKQRQSASIRLGYYQPGTHQVIEFEDCLLIPAEWSEILAFIGQGLNESNRYKGSNGSNESNEPNGSNQSNGHTRFRLTDTFPLKHILLRQSSFTGEIAVIWIVASAGDPWWRQWISQFGPELMTRFPAIRCLAENINPRPEAAILGPTTRVIYGRPRLLERIGDLKFLLSPVSFYQVNPAQTEVLYQKVFEYAALTGNETVIDIYCGVGTIGIFLARAAAQLIGIEVVSEAVRDARANARLNGLQNAVFYEGTAEACLSQLVQGPRVNRGRGWRYKREPESESLLRDRERVQHQLQQQSRQQPIKPSHKQDEEPNPEKEKTVALTNTARLSDRSKDELESGIRYENDCSSIGKANRNRNELINDNTVVVLDPPRRGCELTVLEAVAKLAPSRIIYVSCNPATLARDLRILVDKGYQVQEVQPVDMFPWTYHVECVVLITRVKD